MAVVVYHLFGNTVSSTVAVNGTHRNPELKFPWDVCVPYPRYRSKPNDLEPAQLNKWNTHNPFGN